MLTVLTAPFAIAQWPEHAIPVRSWAVVAALGVVCTGIAFVMYDRLIARIDASRAATTTYLVPLFGVGWAWWLLDEPLSVHMAIAGVLILGSVALSQRSARNPRASEPRRSNASRDLLRGDAAVATRVAPRELESSVSYRVVVL